MGMGFMWGSCIPDTALTSGDSRRKVRYVMKSNTGAAIRGATLILTVLVILTVSYIVQGIWVAGELAAAMWLAVTIDRMNR